MKGRRAGELFDGSERHAKVIALVGAVQWQESIQGKQGKCGDVGCDAGGRKGERVGLPLF